MGLLFLAGGFIPPWNWARGRLFFISSKFQVQRNVKVPSSNDAKDTFWHLDFGFVLNGSTELAEVFGF
jgi:hypothetical protein